MSILPPAFNTLSAYLQIAHPSSIASVYGIDTRSVHDACYKHRVPWIKYEGHVIIRWEDAEQTWGVRPDRFAILATEGLFALYEIHPQKKTVIRFISDFLTEQAARDHLLLLGVRRKYAKKVIVEYE